MFPGNPPSELRILIPGLSYALDKRCMARRSARIARMMEKGEPQHDLNNLPDAPPAPAAFELAAKFCYGYSPDLSPENILAVICVATFLDMTEDHSPDNLGHLALSFFSTRVLPHWNETLRCLRGGGAVLSHASRLGLAEACLSSISSKVLADPHLLRNPVEDGQNLKVNRRLFVDWFAEDLTDLNHDLFFAAIAEVSAAGAPPADVARCLHRFARKKARVGAATPSEEYEKNSHRRVIEAVEKLLPTQKAALQIKPLLQMLQAGMALRVSEDCCKGLEQRIGTLLAEASVEDLFIAGHGYARETRHDADCVERVVSHFCSNATRHGGNSRELGKVAALFEAYMAEAAAERGLRKEKFSRLLRMLAWLLDMAGRSGDGVYRAVDVYFSAHGHLTESEREEVCRAALDCRRLSPAMCEQAAQNERMPLRVVAQVLYVGQMHIRDAIAGALKEGEGEEEGETSESGVGKKVEERRAGEEGGVKEKKQGGCVRCGGEGRKKVSGFWRKLGCKDAGYACKCSLRKVHPGD